MADDLKLKMALLADVHLGTPATQFPNQDYTYAADLLRRAVSAIRALAPDELVIVGDLVNMGTAEEYAMAREILDELRKPITTIPGNHELVKGNLEIFFNGAIGARIDDAGLDEALVASVIYLNSGIEGLTPWHWHGAVSAAGLELIDRVMAQRPDRPMIVFCHHPPAGTVRLPGYPMMELTNSDEVLTRLTRHQQPVVMFCGHTHVPDVYRRRNLTIVSCPPLCFWPHGFVMVELRNGLMHIRFRRLIERVEDSPDPYLKKPGYVAEREPWVTEITLRIS